MYLVCLFEARPEHRDTLLAALEKLVAHARTEPGTLQYELLTETAEPNRIVVFERYTNTAALDAHLNAAPVSATLARFGEWLATEPILLKSFRRAGFIRAGLDNII